MVPSEHARHTERFVLILEGEATEGMMEHGRRDRGSKRSEGHGYTRGVRALGPNLGARSTSGGGRGSPDPRGVVENDEGFGPKDG